MTKRTSTKYKIDRRLGVNLWGRPKSPHNARTYRPGQHGQTLAHKPTEYGTQLMAKQKLKGYYGNVSERQFLRYYKEAVRRRGDTSEELIALLESRLDCIIYRLKFAPTVFAARQLVNHGHILVNGKRVNIPSYITQVNDVIEVHPNSRSMLLIMNSIGLAERDIPDYFSLDSTGFKGTFTRIPKFSEVPYATQMSPHLIVEFYSR